MSGVGAGAAFADNRASVAKSDSDRLIAALRTQAYEEEALEEDLAFTSPVSSRKPSADKVSRSTKTKKGASLMSTEGKLNVEAVRSAGTVQQSAAAPTAEPARYAASDTGILAPKTVIAKDVAAIEERQNHAAQLPSVLLQKGLEVKVNVVGELADVIIMSSASFDAQSKDTVIKQVCIDLKALGFKRVHITDGKDYTMHFGL